MVWPLVHVCGNEYTTPLIPKMLSANQPGAPVIKGRGWANCHINPVLLFGIAKFVESYTAAHVF